MASGDDEPPADNGYAYGAVARDAPLPTATTTRTKTPRTRVLAPDLLRGLLMALMAMDHTGLPLNAWQHGTGRVSESDGAVVASWNRPAAYVVRTATHLCGAGFAFLLGMGVVYLGASRTRMGWGAARLARYFAERAVVLSIVTVVMGLVMTAGKVWLMNVVLFALAADYFLAGMLWLGGMRLEGMLARAVDRVLDGRGEERDAERPLLNRQTARDAPSQRAASIAWHAHNILLLIMSVVTIWWNIWFSDTHGHCPAQDAASPTLMDMANDPNQPITRPSQHPLLDLWIWPVMTKRIMSVFPPLAWLSFAILGLLYGRILSARPWTPRVTALGHLSASLLFGIVFVLTRVLRVGNLSEDCLHTPDQSSQPTGANPYLASPASFFYLVKYPPDVAFWAFTLAGNLLLLGVLGAVPRRMALRATVLLDFGTAALFFYVVHLFVVFGIGGLAVKWFGYDVGRANPINPGVTRGIDSLWGFFATWGTVMLVMWPLTRWYGRFKSGKPADSIWRFF